jgi:hypothetical protein
MSNSTDIQRRVALARCKERLAAGASLDHVLGLAWNAGFLEGDRDTGAETDAEFDARVREINEERDRVEAGDCSCSRGGSAVYCECRSVEAGR